MMVVMAVLTVMIVIVVMIVIMIALGIAGLAIAVQHGVHHLVQRVFLHGQMTCEITSQPGEN